MYDEYDSTRFLLRFLLLSAAADALLALTGALDACDCVKGTLEAREDFWG